MTEDKKTAAAKETSAGKSTPGPGEAKETAAAKKEMAPVNSKSAASSKEEDAVDKKTSDISSKDVASSKDTTKAPAADSSNGDHSAKSTSSCLKDGLAKQEDSATSADNAATQEQKISKETSNSAPDLLTSENASKSVPSDVSKENSVAGAEAKEKDVAEAPNSKQSQNDQEKAKEDNKQDEENKQAKEEKNKQAKEEKNNQDKEEKNSQNNKEKKVIVQRIQVSKENLWVSNVSKDTTAKDLKNLFSKYGKVQAVKIVTSARSVNSKATFGFVTMENAEQAQKCIKFLNNTELKGNMISVDSVKQEAPLRSRNDARSVKPDSQSGSPGKDRSRQDERRRPSDYRISRSAHSSSSRSEAKFPEKRRRSPSPTYRRTPPHLRHKRTPSPYRKRTPSPLRRRRTPSPFRRDRYQPTRRHSPLGLSRSPLPAGLSRSREYDARPPYYDSRSRSPIRGISPPYRAGGRSSSPMSSMLTFDLIKEERLREQQRQRVPREAVGDKLDYLQEHNLKEMQRLEWERDQIRKEKEALERERAHILELEKQKQLEMRLTIEKEKRMLEERKNKLQQSMKMGSLDGSIPATGFGMPLGGGMPNPGPYWSPSGPPGSSSVPTPWGPSGPMFSRPMYGGPMGIPKKP